MHQQLTFVLILLLSLVTTSFVALGVQGEEASGTIYILADGTISPITAPIFTTDNTTYTLTTNITSNSDGIIVQRNNIVIDGNGYALQGQGSGTGVALIRAENVTLQNTNIMRFYCGVKLESSSSNVINGNSMIANNSTGISVLSSFSNRIIGNSVKDSEEEFAVGIRLRLSDHNNISGNYISANYLTGIWIYESYYNSLIENHITNCINGISTYSSNFNLVIGNNVMSNYNGFSMFSISNYTFFHNNFINNVNQVISEDSGSNLWNSDYPSGGNYWSDYNGTDIFSGPYQNETGSDGIGDTPHQQSSDKYPLMQRYSSSLFEELEFHPTAFFTTTVETGTEVKFDAKYSTPGWNGTQSTQIEEYYWDFGDGKNTSTNSPNVVHLYRLGGVFDVTLTITDNQGSTGSFHELISIVMPTTLSIQTNSPSSPTNFIVEITGTLCDIYGNGLENQIVIGYYRFPGIDDWIPITSDYTDSLGQYEFAWTPGATGYFTIKVMLNGTSKYSGSNNTVFLTSLVHENTYLISVESNGTISDLFFTEQNRTISFISTGQEGTSSQVRTTIPDSLIPSVNGAKIFVDGTEIAYSSLLSGNCCIIEFKYDNSVHLIEIDLAPEANLLGLNLRTWIIIIAISIVIISATSIGLYRHRRSKKARALALAKLQTMRVRPFAKSHQSNDLLSCS